MSNQPNSCVKVMFSNFESLLLPFYFDVVIMTIIIYFRIISSIIFYGDFISCPQFLL